MCDANAISSSGENVKDCRSRSPFVVYDSFYLVNENLLSYL